MKPLLLYLWQLPQNLLGLCLLAFYKHEEEYHELYGRRFYFTEEMPTGISLGNYIIMNREDRRDGMKHEFGHSIQSRRWGWLYLPVIGLLSAMGNLFDRWFHKRWSIGRRLNWYYNLPWEKGADRLGGVKRMEYAI